MKGFGKLVWDQGDAIGGRYQVLQVMRGGMGVVYVVRDLNHTPDNPHNEIMAAKSLLPELAAIPSLQTRFLEEAKFWISLSPHTNILRAYFAEIIMGVPYVFADYIEEGPLPNTLSAWIYRKLTPPEVALFVILQVMDGLSSAYWSNILFHGDLKPSNILIDKACTPKVADWGLSRLSESQVERLRIVGQDEAPGSTESSPFPHRGTPGYAAPELADNRAEPTRAVDVFSLGVILGEMLSGLRFVPGATARTIADSLHSCFALGEKERDGLAEVISGFVRIDPDERISTWDTGIGILGDLITRMTGLRIEPPSIIIKPVDQSWKGQMGYSMLRLGDKSRALEIFQDLDDTSGKEGKPKDMILVDMDREFSFIASQEAMDRYEGEQLRDPADTDSMAAMAYIRFQAGDYKRSRELYERVLSVDSKNERAIVGLMELADKLGQADESLRLGKTLAEIIPESTSRWIRYAEACDRHGALDEGLRACREAGKCGDLSVDDMLVYGDLLFQLGQSKEAEAIYHRALREAPENGYIWYNLGVCQRSLGMVAECMASFTKAIRFNGPEGATYNHLASLSMAVGDRQQAIEYLEAASKCMPDNPRIWFNLGQCMIALDRASDAVRYYEIALSLDPGYEMARRSLEEVRRYIG